MTSGLPAGRGSTWSGRCSRWSASGVVLGLIEQERLGWSSPIVLGALVLGGLALVAFVPWERRTPQPLVDLGLFRARNFAVGNLATLSIYGALGMVGFVVTLFLQEVWAFPAWVAGIATLPPTILLLLLSTTVGSFRRPVRAAVVHGRGSGGRGGGFVPHGAGRRRPAAYWVDVLPGSCSSASGSRSW